jgi:flagellar biosynthesis protein
MQKHSQKFYRLQDPTKHAENLRAVALTYDPQANPVPTVSGSGHGKIAERIIALAKENDIPIRHDPDLVTLLAHLDVGQIIPPELYLVVAEVLAFVYSLKNPRGANHKSNSSSRRTKQ